MSYPLGGKKSGLFEGDIVMGSLVGCPEADDSPIPEIWPSPHPPEELGLKNSVFWPGG